MAAEKVSVYGATGFVGGRFRALSAHQTVEVPRDQLISPTPKILYCIGTTDNYNVLTNPTLDVETNLIHLIKVLEENRIHNPNFEFNFLSSWFVYGDGKLPYQEDSCCKPKGFYSIAKFSAEMFLESYCKTYKINYRIIRLGNVYGNGDGGISNKKNALQYLIARIKKGEYVELYEGGDVVRDYIHVNDVVRALDLILHGANFGEVINCATGIPTKLIDIMNWAKQSFASQSEIRSIPTPEFHKIVQVRDSYLDVSRLKSLGFTPSHNIMEEISNL